MIVTEVGSASVLGIQNKDPHLANAIMSMISKDFSEDYQSLLLDAHMRVIWENRAICRGMVVWCYNDFLEYRKQLLPPETPFGLCPFGIVTQDRKRKKSFETVREHFHAITDILGK